MHLTAYFLASAQQISLGANAKTQAVKCAVCLAIGIAVGIVGLLYFRKSSVAERFLTDLFATLLIGGGYVAVLLLLFGGKFELYGIVSYAIGASTVPCIFKTVKKLRSKKKTPDENVAKD